MIEIVAQGENGVDQFHIPALLGGILYRGDEEFGGAFLSLKIHHSLYIIIFNVAPSGWMIYIKVFGIGQVSGG